MSRKHAYPESRGWGAEMGRAAQPSEPTVLSIFPENPLPINPKKLAIDNSWRLVPAKCLSFTDPRQRYVKDVEYAIRESLNVTIIIGAEA